MGRLIDADAFEKFIKEKYKDGESTDDIKDQMLFDLSYQPTAYNVDEVVAELENKRIEVQKMRNDCIALSDMEVCDIENITYARAINIVRKGGVE